MKSETIHKTIDINYLEVILNFLDKNPYILLGVLVLAIIVAGKGSKTTGNKSPIVNNFGQSKTELTYHDKDKDEDK